ncbi:MAG TPA: 3-hydroxyacyl-CoA dehydrogenase, partial [Flavobacteriaceae bacterium]|nr:3-hydroxyacyl-CoA dehydrogenase [Flavobacteriaceae bacterium]
MHFRIQKVAVLGSGVMGSGIACHLANVGFEVLLLDIPDPKATKPAQKNNLVNEALKKAMASKPPPLYDKSFASKILTGNLEDDLDKIATADWIIEVVVERLDIKQQLFEKVDQFRAPKSLVSTNTSSIPIKLLAEGRSKDFKNHFCGTHFFNPPRYLQLLEIIPTQNTAPEVIDFFMTFGAETLGKKTVLCKDTPAFIANRIGVMSGTEMTLLTDELSLSVEAVDALTGSLIGRPSTATFRLQDLVGLDVGDKVTKFVQQSVHGDVYMDKLKTRPEPKFLEYLLSNKFYGNKTGKGFYEKTSKKDDKGKSIINVLNLESLSYEPVKKPKLEFVKKAKSIELMDKRLQFMIEGDEKEALFFRRYFTELFAYTASRVPEIAEQYYLVDDAMRAGYVWDYGPFEYWDLIGLEKGVDLVQQAGHSIPSWIETFQKKGNSNFYVNENGVRKYFNLKTETYEPLPKTKNTIILNNLRAQSPILKNSECVVHDIGDGVMCLEFTSKSNSIGEGIGQAMNDAVEKAETEGWNGLVIGNNAKQFSVGANLMNIGMLAMQKQYDSLEKLVYNFQQTNMRMRTAKVPVVVATQGYVFGGGCEIAMHCDAGVYAAESYIGLVEVGVGLLPGGGGTKEFALRASDEFFEGDVQMPTLIKYFKSIATAAVATSAHEAFHLKYLKKGRDSVVVNTGTNLGLAKKKVLSLAENYVAPGERKDITVLGRAGMSVLYSAINEFRLGDYMTDY